MSDVRYSFNPTEQYVKISVTGKEIVRFLNICLANGIQLHDVKYIWQVEQTESQLLAVISVHDYFKLRRPVRLTCVKVRVIDRYGLYFVLRQHRKHISFLVGIIIAVVIIKIASLHLWKIEISGNHINTYNQIVKVLSENDISIAMATSLIDCSMVEELLKDNLIKVTWISVRISGTSLIIDMQESTSGIYSVDYASINTNSDILSEYEGYISYIVTRTGTPLVTVGDYVHVGDVLVRGEVDINDDNGEIVDVIGVEADADIYITTTLQYEKMLSLKYTNLEYSGDSVKAYNVSLDMLDSRRYRFSIREGILFNVNFGKIGNLDIFGSGKMFNFHLLDSDTLSSEYIKVEEIRDVVIGGVTMPITYGVETYYKYNETEVKLSEEAAEIQLRGSFSTYIKKLSENDVQLIDYRVNIDTCDDIMTLQAELDVNIRCR